MPRTLAFCLAFAVLSLAASRADAFCVEHPTNPAGGTFDKVGWASMPVTYRMHDTGSATGPVSTVDKAAEQAAIRAAFDQWAAVACASITFTEGSLIESTEMVNLQHTMLEIRVYWARDTTEWGGTNTQPIAKTWYNYDPMGNIISSAVVLNAIDKLWSTTGETDKYDVQSVMATEVGRLIGLAASTDTSAVMWPSFVMGSTDKRTLTADDEAAVAYLYPADADAGCADPGTPDPACPTTQPQQDGGTTPTDGGTTPQQDGGTTPQQDGSVPTGDGGTQSCSTNADCPSGVCQIDGTCLPVSSDGDGCGCRVGASTGAGCLALGLLIMGLALARIRRRR